MSPDEPRPVAHPPFTQPWADAFRDAINASEAYRASGQGWRWPVALILEPAPEHGFPDPIAMVLDLEGGACRSAVVLPADAAEAPFAVRGPYDAWREIAQGTLDPIAGIMRRRLSLAGSLPTLLAHVQSARDLVACARDVETDWNEE